MLCFLALFSAFSVSQDKFLKRKAGHMGMAKCRKFTMISGECYWDRGRDLNGGNKSFRVEKMTSQWKWILCMRKTHLLLAAAQVCSEAMPLDIICRIVLNTTIIREPVHRGDSIREIIAPFSHVLSLFK